MVTNHVLYVNSVSTLFLEQSLVCVRYDLAATTAGTSRTTFWTSTTFGHRAFGTRTDNGTDRTRRHD